MEGKLTIVPTPIGNLGDMTTRAIDALQEADVVCAEDTRVTGKLLAAFDISGKRLERLDENIVAKRAASIAQRVLAGERIAYCSDAGMPGVSDPGLRLVRAAREASAPVEVLPGPSAAVTAYVASGTANTAFYFGGFLPRKAPAKRRALESLASLDAALVFYESPVRIVATLECAAAVFPHRVCTVCRELTKLHEEVVRGTAADVHAAFAQRESVKGEIVIVIDGPTPQESAEHAQAAEATAAETAAQLARQGLRPKEIATQLAQEHNIPRNQAYEIALQARE